ncbi:PD-(D/E)XK motif protein [Bacillus sp. NTK074B]|uniref:PD-(D/E)XK motif protein n=1 Tax=Bacillus sp. NTK074B TaxID=2802174 RepID=UPI001A8C2F41|nr:PD-(D/E)XK motif protein [Bacillus sp. NTK074B]
MNLAEEIRKKFANLSDNSASKIEGYEEDFSSWVIKYKNNYAVGIMIDEKIKINESFANVSFYTDWFRVNDTNKHLLVLSSSDESLRNEFAGICALFLETPLNGSKREELMKNPIRWWKDWKNLIGNKSVEKNVHGVIGELVILYYLKKCVMKNINAENWTGPEGKSIDIRTESKNYEVKSSLIKYNNIVTISGQYQLNYDNHLSLMVVKLEDPGVETLGSDIVSIESLIKNLKGLGVEQSVLNAKVSKLGIKENSLDRKKQFRVLKVIEYPVKDDFPLIDMNNLDGIANKDRILQVTYKVDLSGLENEEIEIEF